MNVIELLAKGEYRLAVLGSGPVSFIFADILAQKVENLLLWVPEKELAQQLTDSREYQVLDGSHRLRHNIEITHRYEAFKDNNYLIVVAASSRQLEDIIEQLFGNLNQNKQYALLILTHGLCSSKIRRKYEVITYSQYIKQLALKEKLAVKIAVASGPSILAELSLGQHAFLNISSSDEAFARSLEQLIQSSTLHATYAPDILAVELGGVLKNPIAIACGLAEGMRDCGANFQGELIRQGFAEILQFSTLLKIETGSMLLQSGLADLITTSISSGSRNKQFGMQFVRNLSQESMSLLDRFQAIFSPRSYIEKQASTSKTNVEGLYALGLALEIATEKKMTLPLFQTIFDILSRQKQPGALIETIAGVELRDEKLIKRKQSALTLVSGQNFEKILLNRIYSSVINTTGLLYRIKKQAPAIIPVLQSRLLKARQKKQDRETTYLPAEIKLWTELKESEAGMERNILERLIRFYIQEISDNFSPYIRGGLVRLLGPLRFLVGGMRLGAGFPFVGGAIKEIKQLSRSSTAFYAPTHKSHLDSVEVAFGLTWAGLPVPRYAAGINLMTGRFFGGVLKSLGAYAVDRDKTRNFLYLECLNAYATVMLEAGIPSLVYPEGTRSRSGGLGSLKTGLLSTAFNAYRNSGSEVLIVPVTISYENVPEDLEFTGIRRKLSWLDFIRMRTRVYVDFASPIPVSDYIASPEPGLELSRAIYAAWQHTARVLPNHLIGHLLKDGDTIEALINKINNFLVSFKGNISSHDPHKIVKQGLRALKKREIVAVKRSVIAIVNRPLLEYYGNMVPYF